MPRRTRGVEVQFRCVEDKEGWWRRDGGQGRSVWEGPGTHPVKQVLRWRVEQNTMTVVESDTGRSEGPSLTGVSRLHQDTLAGRVLP